MVIAAMVVTGSPIIKSHEAEAVSSTSPIRVVISLKSSQYDNSLDTVNLVGRTGNLDVGFQSGGVFRSVYQHQSATAPLRGSLDDFYIIVKETANWNEAQSAAQLLVGKGLSYNILAEKRGSNYIYQVVQGYYETMSEAQQRAGVVKAISPSFTGTIAGWYRLRTSSVYTTYTDAQKQVDMLQAKSIAAYVAGRQSRSGVNSYEVWLGNASTVSDRDALQKSLSAAGVQSQPVDFKENYILFKQDVTGLGAIGQPIVVPHIYVQSAGQEVVVKPLGNPAVIRVEEKKLTYRGSMILRGYRERLAVINSVALDDYLKGVVPIEMATGWPLEALKAQAVAARSYVVRQPADKWVIAQVDDTTYEQAYRGYTWEQDDTSQAVDQTRGQVLMYNNGTPNDTSDDVVAQTFFSANHGGISAASSEVWGSNVPYLVPVDSHWDEISAKRWPYWYRVQLPSGLIGYIVETAIALDGTKNLAGFPMGHVTTANVNVRAVPDVINGRIIGSAGLSDNVVILDKIREYDDFSWMNGPYSPIQMRDLINDGLGRALFTSPIMSLRVTKTGPSGRAMEVQANGTVVPASTPYSYTGIFSVTSGLFSVEQQGTYTVLGANGRTTQFPSAKQAGVTMHVLGAGQTTPTPMVNGSQPTFVVYANGGKTRVATKDQNFIIHGAGNGHGLGLSQWGARGMAEDGYKYDQILRQYYTSNTYLSPLQ